MVEHTVDTMHATSPSQPELIAIQGVFGGVDVTPLVSDLFPQAIIDAIAVGFARSGGNSSGLVQNDGQVFPNLSRRSECTFCDFCKMAREMPDAAKSCGLSDQGGVRLVAGSNLSSEEEAYITRTTAMCDGVTCYYCHAGFLEMLAPIELYLGEFGESESVRIAALWGGQFVDEFLAASSRPGYEAVLQTMGDDSRTVGLSRPTLPITKEERFDYESNLISTAQAISRALTDLYHQRERQRAVETVTEFSRLLGEGHKKCQEESEKLYPTSRHIAIIERQLETGLRDMVSRYGLRASFIVCLTHEPGATGTVRATFRAGKMRGRSSFVTGRTTQFQPESGPLREILGQPLVVQGSSDPLVQKLVRAVGADPGNDAITVTPFASEHTGEHLWVSIERGERRWQIRHDWLQPAFNYVLTDLIGRISICLDQVQLLYEREVMLEESRKSYSEIQRIDKQRTDLVTQMSHSVSRPMMQMRMASESLASCPSDSRARARFESAAVELDRASANFDTYADLAADDDKKRNTDKDDREPLNLLEAIQRACELIEPFMRLDRRAVEVYVRGVDLPPKLQSLSPFAVSDDPSRKFQERILIKQEMPAIIAHFEKRKVRARRKTVDEALENLVHNAVKYSIGGQAVEIRPLLEKGGMTILVTNYGCGVDEDEFEKIFEKAYRSERVKQLRVEGAGIGLWITREMIVRDGGEVCLLKSEFYDEVPKMLGSKKDIRGPARPRYTTVFRVWLPHV